MVRGAIRTVPGRVYFALFLLLVVLGNNSLVANVSANGRLIESEEATAVLADPTIDVEDHLLQDEALAALTADEPRFELQADMAQVNLPLNQGGEWGPVIVWPHTPVSMANLPDGRILTWSGSEREHWPSTEQTYSAVWQIGHRNRCMWPNDNRPPFPSLV